MSDIPVRQFPIIWRIKPPEEMERRTLFTAVGQIESRVEPCVFEAFAESLSGVALEQFDGTWVHTGPAFNNDGLESTYIWFNIMTPRTRGTLRYKFRISWRFGRHMFGAQETFDVKIRKRCPPPWYCTDDQDLLASLEPNAYEPTPIELMIENS
ncbi:hypothetical protein GGR51DRAFT_574513 [Nemania sp. FL0031]|nr:hypothetical protein GGR51DRAFT_574513 [Nemania sp. FL0031]